MPLRYDHPNCTIRREQSFTTAAGNGAIGARLLAFQTIKLKAVHAQVVVAGTSDSPGHALTIKNGTTSIGALALGTAVAGDVVSVTGLDITVPTAASAAALTGQVNCTNGTDATGTAVVTYEYEVLPEASQSA